MHDTIMASIDQLRIMNSKMVNEKRIELAMERVKDGSVSINESAKIHQISPTTLKRRIKGGRSRSAARVGSHHLTAGEEDVLVDHVLSMEKRGLPLTYKLVEQAANDILRAKHMPPVGKRWAARSVKRVQGLKTSWARTIEYKQVVNSSPTALENWFKLYSGLKSEYDIHDYDVYNMDETGFQIGVTQTALVDNSADRPNGVRIKPGDQEWASVIICIAADGFDVPPMILLRRKNVNSGWADNAPKDWLLRGSRRGWTDNDAALNWLKHFDQFTIARAQGRYRLLIVDGHESHCSVAFKDYCDAHKIILTCLPAHTSHLTQPLDVGVFSSLKHFYSMEVEEEQRSGEHRMFERLFVTALARAYEKAVTESNACGAFRGAGLIPLNPDAVLSKLPILQTPSPEPESESWHSQTPKGPSDLQKQSTLIDRQLRNHGSSSPGYIIEAFSKLEKFTHTIITSGALLDEELKHLKERYRETNRNRGGVGISSEEAVIAGVAGLYEKFATLRKQAEAISRGTRHCGTCGGVGHNTRTCSAHNPVEEESLQDS